MALLKITDITAQFGLSSRSLRYYEQVGLINSIRSDSETYRHYDAENVERLKQIIVLRKMQIPIKDIIRIYESQDMSVVVQTFVARIEAIDDEIGALSEMKRITNEFLHTMLKNGIRKISALPLLYEGMERELTVIKEHTPVTGEELLAASERLAKAPDIGIVSLPPMRMLSSYRKDEQGVSDIEGFSRHLQARGIIAAPGQHERFEFQTETGEVMLQRMPEDNAPECPYLAYLFEGGLFAQTGVFLDDDVSQRFRAVIAAFDDNAFYQIDYGADGGLRHPAMLENLISPDERRQLVALLVPVKKRLADPALFDKAIEVTDISIEDIEAANPILWTVDVPMDSLTPINGPHYRVTEDGEAEYTGWISTRVLGTNISVMLPFRVDIEFRLLGDDEHFGYGDSEGSMVIYHGDDAGYFSGSGPDKMGFGINTGNKAATDAFSPQGKQQALSFRQPIFRDAFVFPGRGGVEANVYNRVTWIIGPKHLAAIINGEIRYCGIHFPYMAADLSRQPALPIVVGSNGQGMKYFKSIRISQLADMPKNKLRAGDLTVTTKQSNNLIPIIHRLVTDEKGENYWFNGCACYVMECLGEKEYDYVFFAGLTGDVFTQHYAYDKHGGDGLTSYKLEEDDKPFFEGVFAKCGYAATHVLMADLRHNTHMYRQTMMSYIDRGIPVIAQGKHMVGVIVGYEEHGSVLLYITGNSNQPERMALEEALSQENDIGGWLFVGEKRQQPSLADIYREAVGDLPRLLMVQTPTYCFGPAAFRAWADAVENGKFDGMTHVDFDPWAHYTNYICVLATNGSCCHGFLKRARELNPDMAYLEDVSKLYQRTADIWNNDNDKDLEALGGGFNVTLEALQDKQRRGKIAERIREAGACIDEVVRLVSENTKEKHHA